jgi:hypothetical protein
VVFLSRIADLAEILVVARRQRWHDLEPDRQRQEAMAKEQITSNKEIRKPKTDKPKGSVSTYNQSLSMSGHQSLIPA